MLKTSDFGSVHGRRAACFRITNGNGAYAEVLDFGATLRSFAVIDGGGRPFDVVLGYDSAGEYDANAGYLGATVGRFANRITGARFALDGKEHALTANEGPNCLHGGGTGFHRSFWEAWPAQNAVCFTRRAPDGENGFPGNLDVRVTFTLGEDNTLSIEYYAQTDAPTPVSLTNHAYFNLDGASVTQRHSLRINAERYLETDGALLPTGRVLPVSGTALDLRGILPLGQGISALPGGFDHCYALTGTGMREAAFAQSEKSGVTLCVYTDRPAIQLYTAGGLNARGKGGRAYRPFDGFCLETQAYPDAPNQPSFPSCILRPGEAFASKTVYRPGLL